MIGLVKSTFVAFGEDKAPRLAAAIAYSTIFSIAPLFIVLIAIVGWLIGVQHGGHGHRAAEDLLVGQIQKSAGTSASDTVRQMISASFNKPRQGVIAQVIGWIAFLFGASALFSSLQDALNAIWHVEGTKGGWKQMLRDRVASFGMILVIGFLLLVSFVASVALGFIQAHVLANVPVLGNPVALAVVSQIVSLVFITAIFAAIYKVLPDVSVGWKDVWIGAAVTAILFIVGEAGIAVYIRYAGVASAYGAAGSLLAALVWIYYSAIILLLGAEFTKVYAGSVRTLVPSTIRSTQEHPAGVDPRVAGKTS